MSTINAYRLLRQLEELGCLTRKIYNMIPNGAPILREKAIVTCSWKLGAEGHPDICAKIVDPGLPSQHGRLMAEPLRQDIETRAAAFFSHILLAMPALAVPGLAISLSLAPGPNDGAHYALNIAVGGVSCYITPPPLARADLCLEKIEILAEALGELPAWDGTSLWLIEFWGATRAVHAASHADAAALLERLVAHERQV